jgi:hypothetical protein
MAVTPKDNSISQEGKALSAIDMAKDLIGTAIITFLILTPVVALKTTMNQGVLTISQRWDWVFYFVAIVVGVRLLLQLVFGIVHQPAFSLEVFAAGLGNFF